FFFFQAEDGIRDRNVTGVQTCALPISIIFSVLGSNAISIFIQLAIFFTFLPDLISYTEHLGKGVDNMPLDPNNAIPLHIQLKELIETRITKGVFSEQIPSERKVMEKYNVSRSTVREAINLLVREGILEKRNVKGTFVSLKPIHDWLGNLTSTTETIRQMGMKPGAKLITHYPTTPTPYIQERTGFKTAYFIKRIRYADDIPIGIERHYYPVTIGEQLIKYDLDNATL